MEPIFQELVAGFVAKGSPCAWIAGALRKSDIVAEILGHESVMALKERLVSEATFKGEWIVLSHDATFKTAFSLIGQEKMAQSERGESCLAHRSRVVGRYARRQFTADGELELFQASYHGHITGEC